MVDSLWFVLALVLLAVVSVALVLVLVLRREEAHCGRETRTEYLQAQLWADRRVPRLVRAQQ